MNFSCPPVAVVFRLFNCCSYYTAYYKHSQTETRPNAEVVYNNVISPVWLDPNSSIVGENILCHV